MSQVRRHHPGRLVLNGIELDVPRLSLIVAVYNTPENLRLVLAALERLYADASLRHKIGRAGAAWILAKNRTWTTHARQLKSLILSI